MPLYEYELIHPRTRQTERREIRFSMGQAPLKVTVHVDGEEVEARKVPSLPHLKPSGAYSYGQT